MGWREFVCACGGGGSIERPQSKKALEGVPALSFGGGTYCMTVIGQLRAKYLHPVGTRTNAPNCQTHIRICQGYNYVRI